jgi:hypothetical protein
MPVDYADMCSNSLSVHSCTKSLGPTRPSRFERRPSFSDSLQAVIPISFLWPYEQEIVDFFIVRGTDNSGAAVNLNLFVVGTMTGSAYGFTAAVGLQMCLFDGTQCYPSIPVSLFAQSKCPCWVSR